MSDSARELLVRGIAAAKAGDKEEARFFLEWVLRTDASQEQQVDVWYYLSQIADDPAVERECLENVLVRDPTHPEARRGLAVLDGRLDPAAIIDPNRAPNVAPAPQPLTTRRFVCQQCGGKLTFSPDGQQLVCAYCNIRMTLHHAVDSGAMIEEQDFTVALATAKGHSHPVTSHTLTCQSCGVSFLLPPQSLSLTCPYCASAYVVQVAETRALIPPEGVIPFTVTRDQADAALRAWLRQCRLHNRVTTNSPHGVYVPAWTFDVGGAVEWRGLVTERHAGGITQAARSGSYPVFYNDVLVPASHTLPAELTAELRNCKLDSLVPYDAAYLVDWPAEIYQISVADASLAARRIAWQDARETTTTRVSVEVGYTSDLSLSSAGMMIESYKLILLPLWIVHYRLDNADRTAVVNGQTGSVRSEGARGGLRGLLERLL
jgi:DNA-directed RNA polymerase subunit RPC12/RpoP